MTPDPRAVLLAYHATHREQAIHRYRLRLGIRGEARREALHHSRLVRLYRSAMQ